MGNPATASAVFAISRSHPIGSDFDSAAASAVASLSIATDSAAEASVSHVAGRTTDDGCNNNVRRTSQVSRTLCANKTIRSDFNLKTIKSDISEARSVPFAKMGSFERPSIHIFKQLPGKQTVSAMAKTIGRSF